jgi:hypothetical protein
MYIHDKELVLVKLGPREYHKLSEGKRAVLSIGGSDICTYRKGMLMYVYHESYPIPIKECAYPYVTAIVESIDYVTYCSNTQLGHAFYYGGRPADSEMIQILVTLAPLPDTRTQSKLSRNTPALIDVLAKWRVTLEEKARKVRVTDKRFQRASRGTPIECHFHGDQLNDDEFCALTVNEQVACLLQLSEAINTNLNNLNKLVKSTVTQAKNLGMFMGFYV